jgi:uncharacterized protein (DUF433 family)
MAPTLSTTEVAAITGLNERNVRKDVEYGVVRSATPPRFAEPALLYFAVLASLEFHLRVPDRKRLYGLISTAFAAKRVKVDLGSCLQLDLKRAWSDIEDKLQRFFAWKDRRIVTDESILGGEPVFRGTRLAVRHIGEMVLRKVSRQEIQEDYPYLTGGDIDFAKLYAIAYPRVGRPRDQAPPR